MVEDDDAYSRCRRILYLIMTIILTLGVTLAVIREEPGCGTDLDEGVCQIVWILIIVVPIKALAKFCFIYVLPSCTERSRLRGRHVRGCMFRFQWIFGVILLLGIFSSGWVRQIKNQFN